MSGVSILEKKKARQSENFKKHSKAKKQTAEYLFRT